MIQAARTPQGGPRPPGLPSHRRVARSRWWGSSLTNSIRGPCTCRSSRDEPNRISWRNPSIAWKAGEHAVGFEPDASDWSERRGWDSNPRTGYPVTSLAGKPDRPDSGTSPCCVADRTQQRPPPSRPFPLRRCSSTTDQPRPRPTSPPTLTSGAVAERTNAPVLKTGDPQGFEGSNPSRSAETTGILMR